jgi:antitoxin component YwqK of YwqJK toxin-antitoxin module
MKKLTWFIFPCCFTFLFFGCTAPKDTRDQDSVQYVHKYGTNITSDEWYEYGQSGQIITHLDNHIQLAESYENGILHGDRTLSFPNDSTVEKKEVYDHGKLKKIIFYHPSNLPLSQTEFLGKSGICETKWSSKGYPHVIETYQNGKLIEGQYFNQKGALESKVKNQSGVRMERDFNGTLLKKEIVEDGLVTLSITFYEDLFPKTITTYDKRQIHGMRNTYLPKGEPQSQEAYSHGVLHGPATTFSGGSPIHFISYKQGKKWGIEQIFSNEGDLIKETTWHNGIKHGPATFIQDGRETVEWFWEGEPATQVFFEQKAAS